MSKKHLMATLSLLLAVLFILGSPVTAYAQTKAEKKNYRHRVFEDVLRNNKYYWEYYDLNQLGIFEGKTRGKSYKAHPDKQATVKYVCGLLYWGYGDKVKMTDAAATDTLGARFARRSKWFKAVSWAYDLGLISRSQALHSGRKVKKVDMTVILTRLGLAIDGVQITWSNVNHPNRKIHRDIAVAMIADFTALDGYDPTRLHHTNTVTGGKADS